MSGHSTYQPQNKFLQWLEKRLPIGGLIHSSFIAYPTPRKKSINDSFRQAKARYGIITSLPFSAQDAATSDTERLRGLLRSRESRDFHWQEIEELIRKKPELLPVYSQEMGRVQARKYRRKLKEIGIKEGWFAIIEGIIIAGGQDQKEVEKAANSLLPKEKRHLVHIFHLKRK